METPTSTNVGHIVETFRRECYYIAGDGLAVSRQQYQPLWENTCLPLSQYCIHLVNGRSSIDAVSLNPVPLCNVVYNSS